MKKLEGYTKSHDGTEIHYTSEGEGFPLIACNGILCSTDYWVYLRSFFRDSCQVVTWDYRGHGKSGLPVNEKNHTMDDFAADLLSVMKELNISKAVLTGHSMGVQLILEFYKKHPERVMGLIPILGTYGRPFTSFYGQSWVDKIMPIFLKHAEKYSGIISFFAKPLISSPLSVPSARLSGAINWYLAPGDIMEKYFAQIADMDLGFAFRALRSMGNHTAEDVLNKISVPTLIIAGENDPFTPAEQSEKMHRIIKNSELLMIRKGTHTALIEQPDLMHLRMELFLRHHFKDQGYVPLIDVDSHLFQKKEEKSIISKALKLIF